MRPEPLDASRVGSKPLRTSQYIGYAAGDAANNLTFSMVSAFLLIYYTDVAGINWPDYDYSGRADWNMRGGQTLTGRYQWTHQLRENEEVVIGEQTVQDNTQQNFGATWTHILSNAVVGEFRYGLGVRSTSTGWQLQPA